ncbi:putative Integrase, catalytic region (fragment) [Magnetospirillum sp. XM-1]
MSHRECLTIVVARNFTAQDVLDTMAELFVSRGVPTYIHSDNGPEMTAIAVREWLGKLRDELLNGEIFNTMTEARIIIEHWRRHYNTVRPHSSLGWRPPAPEAIAWPRPPSLRSVAPGQATSTVLH